MPFPLKTNDAFLKQDLGWVDQKADSVHLSFIPHG